MRSELRARGSGGKAAVLALLAVCACGAPKDMRVALQEAEEREAASLELVSASSADGRVFVQAEAQGPLRFEPADEEGVYALRVPITSDSTIDCLVLPAAYQLGNLVAKAAGDVPSLPVLSRRLFNLDAGLMSERPFVSIEWGGLTQDGGERAYFEVKAAAVGLGIGSLLCLLDDIGYRNTFRRVLNVMAASIRLKGSEPEREPEYRQIYVFEAAGRPMGFAEERFHRLEDGSWVILNRSTMLLPRSIEELTGWDTVSIQRADADGRLMAEAAAAAEPGGGGYELELRALQPGEYGVAGTFEGERIQQTFKTTTILPDDRGVMNAIAAALIQGRQEQISIERWQPRPDPLRPTEIVVRRLGRGKEGETRCEIVDGTMRYSVMLDAAGAPSEIRTNVGDAEIVQRRILVRGALND